MREAQKEYGWKLNFGNIAMLWRSGCIIRSVFLEKSRPRSIKTRSFQLLLDDYFKKVIDKCQPSWRRVISQAVLLGVPLPAFSSALAFFDGIGANSSRRICCRRSAIFRRAHLQAHR